ncbi:Gfo/Idh/MocA family protein [Granulicella aggregans]|uniref:Gfo/Idh/MocA family protein n=1 Tax=Granulicella aggregans TaxID=474949 RepID=UPI0021E0FAA4|nr:Gfo/Idh/MocA family oxidoreductase [Granulicella aggregans]
MTDETPKSTRPLRVAVAGAGAFGKNHLRVYKELEAAGQIQLTAVIDRDPATLAAAAELYAIPGFATLAEALTANLSLDAASVCVPTIHHAAAAEELMRAGVDVLIEKPIAATEAEANRILSLAATLNRIVQVGHLERFNPAVAAARAHLNRPMFFESHRLSIFTPRSLDVDVVLDLMIHDLDIVLSLVASPVREVRAVGLPVLSQKVDIANVRVEFENGCIANFTASRVSTERVRKLRFFQPRQYLSLDFARQDLLIIDAPDVSALAALDPSQLAALLAAAKSGDHPSPGLGLRNIDVPKGEPLRLEIESFLQAVRNRETPIVSAKDATAALALALEITTAIEAHAKRAGL